MRRITLAVLASAAFLAPAAINAAPASAAIYSCTSTVYAPDCQYANRYVCSGSVWWAYRFWQTIYNFNGTIAARYRETLVDRYTNGRLVQSFYTGGWSYSPC